MSNHRTTLSLDPDVAASLQMLHRSSGRRWKEIVNSALRLGLRQMADQSPEASREPYHTDPVDPGPPAITGMHSVHDLLAFAEGEDFR